MKVTEARVKVCPFIQTDNSMICCITTECMAWRFDKQYLDKPTIFGPVCIGYSQTDGYCERLSK